VGTLRDVKKSNRHVRFVHKWEELINKDVRTNYNRFSATTLV